MANTSRSQREAARRGKIEELRREQRAKERKRTLAVIGVLAVVILAVVVAVTIALVRRGSSSAGSQIIPSTPSGGPVTAQKPVAKATNDTGVQNVIAYDTKDAASDPQALSHDHVTGPVTYSVIPPVGGPHNAVWMNAGVYTEPIPSERAVHNLEHGAVWITYRPSLPAAQVKALTDFVGSQSLIDESSATRIAGQSNRYVDLSPWSDDTLPAPIVISSWGYQLYVNSPTDPRLQDFVDTFRNSQKYTPEFGSAVDGEPIQTGGRPASFGSSNPNPTGVAPGQ